MIPYTLFRLQGRAAPTAPRFFYSLPFLRVSRKDKTMKIYVYYEDKKDKTYFDVPEDECTIMIQTDYERRLREADEGEEVMPRSVQEIIDDEINKPTFNNNQTETRRHIHIEDVDPEDRHFDDGTDILSDYIKREGFEELYAALEQLEPQQRELVNKVFWEEMKQTEIAKAEGVKKASIESRLHTIYNKIAKYLVQ